MVRAIRSRLASAFKGGKTGGLARFVSVSGSRNGAMAACTDSAACIFHDPAFTAAPQPPSPGLFINPAGKGVGTRALAPCREKAAEAKEADA